MPDNFYQSDDPTERFQPPAQQPQQPQQPPPAPGQQGKLVLGSFQDAPKRSQRQPYQYQPQPPQQSTGRAAQQQPYQQGQPQRYPQGQRQPGQPPIPPVWATPGQNANATRYPSMQPGPIGNPGPGVQPPARLRRRKRRRNGCIAGCLTVILLIGIVGALSFSTLQRVLAFGSVISTQAPLSSQNDYMNTSSRINLLVMGYGGTGHDGADLTDSMLVVSVIPSSRHTSLISVPRDLWVQVPANSGNYGKINSVYEYGANFGKDPKAGGDAAAQKVSEITGLNVQYWMTINFLGFRDLINSIGGVDVYVPDSFNACYPANDNANINAAWIKVQFNKGLQHMDGETAIRYARAREPLSVCGMGTSENPAELTDFARSARQQLIVKAVLSKIRQISTWPKLFDAMTALEHTIYTNMSLADLSAFALKMDMSNPHTARIGLSNQNVLMDSTSNDGQYILLPQNNDWGAIKDYVKQHLYN